VNALPAAALAALWLGILTSISPCPLASNIAAVAYLGRGMASPRRVLASGLAYSAGRSLTYIAVGALVVWSLLSIPSLSFFLQRWTNQILGPLLILLGIATLGWLPLRVPLMGGVQPRLAGTGVLGAAGLGVLFALSFCPVSAGLFFGGLIPLASGMRSRVILPAIYGFGTALPVVFFAVLIAVGAGGVARAFRALTQFERVAARVTGIVFLTAGIYLLLTHVLGASL
jgi:cytochrome c-type biogenesis protein